VLAVFPILAGENILIRYNAFDSQEVRVSKTAVGNDQRWFEDIAAAKQRVLLVDYDGTVAPFSRDRHRAFPYPDVPRLLQQIMTKCNTRLIVVSGRAAHAVGPLLGITPVPEIWGAHGIEKILPDGRYEEIHISQEALQRLAQAETMLEDEGLGDFLEVKLAGVAIHWRGLKPSSVLNIRARAYRTLEPFKAHSDLMLTDFEEGVELRLRSANKGDAVRNMLAEMDTNAYIAYLGDDATDEDAFNALQGRGLTVLVGPKHRFTAAQMWLRPPDQLVGFLKVWIAACGGD
jgi:trehalose 6-phosphate phosphatase